MAVCWQISHSNNRVLGHCDHNSMFGNLQQMGVYYTSGLDNIYSYILHIITIYPLLEWSVPINGIILAYNI